MKPIKTFKIGSNAFFEGLDGFSPKDIDEVCIMDSFPLKGNSIHANGLHGKDVFFFRNMDKKGFIDDLRKSGLKMCIGKFLIPEFADYIGLTIEDLKGLKDVIEGIDEKHSYEKIIYDSYIENNGFYLTDNQRQKAYADYIEKRK